MQNIHSSIRRLLKSVSAAVILIGSVCGGGIIAAGTATPAMACGDGPFLGQICTFAFGYCPQNFLPADGALVSVTQNSALFALLGVTYGGNGSSTFALPDLRGRGVAGVGQGTGLSTPVVLGQPLGQQSLIMTQQQMPMHTHGAAFTGGGGGDRTVNIPAQPGTLVAVPQLLAKQVSGAAAVMTGSFLGQGGTGVTSATIYVDKDSPASTAALSGLTVGLTGNAAIPAFSFTVPSGFTSGAVTVQAAGGSQPVSTQSPALGMTQCIATSGIYPSRP